MPFSIPPPGDERTRGDSLRKVVRDRAPRIAAVSVLAMASAMWLLYPPDKAFPYLGGWVLAFGAASLNGWVFRRRIWRWRIPIVVIAALVTTGCLALGLWANGRVAHVVVPQGFVLSTAYRDVTVAMEDKHFEHHRGFDFVAMHRALRRDLRARHVVLGGSTISQQTAKNVFLSNDRTVTRKVQEAALTVALERRFSKGEILRLYAHAIDFGMGQRGVAAASKYYFRSTPDRLTIAQSAILATWAVRPPKTCIDTLRTERGRRRALSQLYGVYPERYPIESVLRALSAPLADLVAPGPQSFCAKAEALLPAARTAAQLRSLVTTELSVIGSSKMSVLVSVDGVGDVVDINADDRRRAGSTQKLFTAGSALLTLGVDSRTSTELVTEDIVGRAGVLDGDLIFRAGGDPLFDGAQLDRLVKAAANAGITRVSGALVLDDSRFERREDASGWEPGSLPYEVGRLSAFSLDGNHLKRPDAGLANMRTLRSTLRRHGVRVDGPIRRGRAGSSAKVIAAVRSAPLWVNVYEMLKYSDTTTAELLTRELGHHAGSGTTQRGAAEIDRSVREAGIFDSHFADGSGLGVDNRTSARSEVAWLRYLARSPVSNEIKDALSLSCVEGTLRQRMCASPAAGAVIAKTGTLDGVGAIAGYTHTSTGRAVTFSIILESTATRAQIRTAIDRALAAIVSAKV